MTKLTKFLQSRAGSKLSLRVVALAIFGMVMWLIPPPFVMLVLVTIAALLLIVAQGV